SVTAGGEQTVLTGAPFSLTGAGFSDPNHDGPWTVTTNSGDGTSSTSTASSEWSIAGSHSYPLTPLGHDYTLTVTVVDAHGARQEAARFERAPTGTPAAHGVVPRAQLDPDGVPQPLGELTRAAAVHARRHHRELGRSDAADRIGATPARLEQPRDAAQRLDAI